MARGFAAVPRTKRYVLANGTLPATLVYEPSGEPDAEGLIAADVTVRDGRIERIDPPNRTTRLPALNLHGGMIFPTFVDMHTHIDKGHIWPRKANPDGTFDSALLAVSEDRDAKWSADDVARRMDFSLRAAYAHGTGLLRTHIDSPPPQHTISWPVFAEMRARWSGRIELQAVSLFGIDVFLDPAYADEITALVAKYGGVLGAATFMVPDLERAIEMMMRKAAEAGLDLDFHVDETADPDAHSLRIIADTAIRLRFPGRIVAGHCCSLARQDDAEAEETMKRVAEAGIAVVSLPMCNMYLQDRHDGRTPYWRGVTRLRELAAHGVPVAVASDNTRDPFYAYGDLDMVEVLREAVRVLHLDHPLADWPRAVARGAGTIIGRPDKGVLTVGAAADLVLFKARNWTELFARPQSDRTVIRSGTAIDRKLPDYRELDDLMGLTP